MKLFILLSLLLCATGCAERLAGEREDVSKVWKDMQSWGRTGPAKMGADFAMYMQDNHMTMDKTTFTMNGGSDAQMDSFFGSTPTSNSNVKKMTVKAGPVGLGRFTLRDSMTMQDSTEITNGKRTHNDKTVVGTAKTAGEEALEEALNLSEESQAGAVEQGGSDARNLYMYGNEMSMKTTTFTMNVGTGSEMSEDLQTKENAASVDTLNINMYMHANDMLMDGTKFEMNVATDMLGKEEEEELIQTGSVASKGIRAGDLVRLALLQVPWVLSTDGASLAKDAKPKTSSTVQSVWDWLKGWSPSTGKSKARTVDVNMFMYNNSMSMTNIDFAMNVGTQGKEELLGTSDGLGTSNGLGTAARDQAAHAAAMGPPPPKYMYAQDASMKDTTFSMGVGNLQSSASESSNAQRQPESVNMYMAQNKMSMSDTIFKMNVGSGSVGLAEVQGGTSEDSGSKATAAGQTLSCKNLNVRMYMYRNSMAMKTTVFTWNVKSSGQLETNQIETAERSRSSLPPRWGVRRLTAPPTAGPRRATGSLATSATADADNEIQAGEKWSWNMQDFSKELFADVEEASKVTGSLAATGSLASPDRLNGVDVMDTLLDNNKE